MRTSTEQKLALLRGTKDAIKAALIEKGQSVIDTDTFRSYADKVLAIKSGGDGAPDGYVTVTFMNGDTVLFTRFVLKGDDCPDPYVQNRIELPTKESTAQYDYTFNGWATADGGIADANALKNITADKTLYAAYTATARKYTVTYYDEDGTTVLHTEQLPYGTMPSYVPTKEGYAFGGWSPNTPVTGDVSYTASWSSVLASGTCGNSAYWSLDTSGVLNIYGTGRTNAYPWRDTYKEQIQKVVVGEGITSLSVGSFNNCANIKSVTFPTTLTTISASFSGCKNIDSVYISDLAAWLMCDCDEYLLSQSNPAFYRNGERVDVGELVVPETATKIGTNACQGWDITGVVFHDGVTSIGAGAFIGCKNITSITIPSSVLTTGGTYSLGAFEECTGLVSAFCGAKTVNRRLFYNCTNLQSVTFGDSVTTIERSVITRTAVTSVTIPASVTSISNEAFLGSSLTSVIFEDTEGWKAGATALASADLANPETAATYLKTTYVSSNWTNS